ncbi:MocR-like pyridoxine biosynthesis transcription factor PdxR [Brevibacillus daliensis]|uniref:MocR-like pyridoxine biosynthesis transcription factor PdxR n=1 Tax=Brevibacillus daliensis TaxID=2892995 RepID=UPI001E51F460|nr:PLP-dependent aminotransferase family protein [Brevibacillus daliensis]
MAIWDQEDHKDLPLYQRLYGYIRREIEQGKLKAGDKLPSVRQMAKEYEISRNTVETAYLQLLEEGYLISKQKSGYYVEHLQPDWFERKGSERGKAEQSEEPQEKQQDKQQDKQQACSPDKQGIERPTYDFIYGETDRDAFPYQEWRSCVQEAIRWEETEGGTYDNNVFGELELREQFADYLYRARGITCQPDEIIIGSGTQQLLMVLCQTIGKDKPVLGMEEPGYDRIRYVFQNHGCQVVPITLDTEGMRVNELMKSNAQLAYVTPSHQYPYGMVMPIQRRMQIIEWAKQTGGMIIEDDYDSEYRYVGKPIPALKGLDEEGAIIYMGTCSKLLLPSLRISYMVVPHQVIRENKQAFRQYLQTVPRFLQIALALFMKKGEWDRHIRRMRTRTKKKHQLLIQALQNELGEKIEIIGSEAGLHLLVQVKTKDTENELIQKALAHGVKVYSIQSYRTKPTESSYPVCLLGFGAMPLDRIEEACGALGRAWG